jgi:endonuclease-3
MKQSKKSAPQVLGLLKRLYPNPRHYLEFENPFQLLVATILSAQCTDERVNAVTKELFKRYRRPHDIATEELAALEEAVRPTGFFRNKAKAIKAASAAIVDRHGGRIPDTMEELTALPGLARKSANAVLQHGFSKVEGIVVDTHVIRVAGRLGWTEHKDPDKIELDLTDLFDRREWRWIPFYLKNHGRAVCKAQKPACEACEISRFCPSAFIEPTRGRGRSRKRKGRTNE